MKWHVFPNGPMCSLKRAMLLWLVPLFLLVGALSAGLSYWSYARMVASFMDEQMQQLGAALADNTGTRPPRVDAEKVNKWGAYVVQVYDAKGELTGSSWPELRMPLLAQGGFHEVANDGRRWRVYTQAPVREGGSSVQVIQSERFRDVLAAQRAGAALAPILLLIPISMFVLWGVARAMSRALEHIGEQAARQDEHHISELSVDHVPREIEPLVSSFNGLLRRLRDAFATQRRFVQDAAHELRTPIAALGLQIENLRCDMTCDAARERYAQLELGVRRAQRLVDQLMRLSRQEAAGADGPAIVDLQAHLRESVNTLIALADQRNIDLGVVDPGQAQAPLTVRCVPGDLRSVLDNLIENALRYTPEGGVVDVRVSSEQGRIALEVVDTGPGIPQELLPRVFDRFFRVPGTGGAGSGLGLAIAQAAAQRCGLALTLRNREDRSGLIARVESVA